MRITGLSSSSISFQVVKGSNFYVSDVYKMSFRFYTPRLSFSGGCSVSSSTNLPRSDGVCTASGNSLILNYSFWDASGNNYHDWPQWSAGVGYSWTFSVTVSGELNSDYYFASMAYSWYKSTYYSRSSQCGTPGCVCNQCP